MVDKFAYMRALMASGLSNAEKVLAASVWNYADQGGRNAFPGIDTLAEDCRTDERNVRRRLKALCAKGWLVQTSQGGLFPGRRYMASVYALAIPQGGSQLPPLKGGHSYPPSVEVEGGLPRPAKGGSHDPRRGVATTPPTDPLTNHVTDPLPDDSAKGGSHDPPSATNGGENNESTTDDQTLTGTVVTTDTVADEPTSTKDLIDQWTAHRIDKGGSPPPQLLIRRMTEQVEKLRAEGQPLADVAAALVELERQGGKGPGFLPFALNAVQNPPKSKTEQILAASLDRTGHVVNPFMHTFVGEPPEELCRQHEEAERRREAERAAAVEACGMCDVDGRRNGGLCSHDRASVEAAARHIAAIRESWKRTGTDS